ncbi:hypothetical protein PP629_gp30 [Streptomyces phage Dubu]|uniref:Uncharacterized protein n=1 Tax=Streptomyces phage Dubu TaxID=2591226 RepID=A0A514DEV7_9CAUD|nr:hypothetical protein PP629_gp30 [Streptomyces phage Dubu]QDH92135.1 hypothetical protein SEA_DUBU_30 [Streptomyces phage Dubu]
MEKFTAGEEVTLTTQDHPVRVLFGPYVALMGRDQDTYLVEFLNGPDKGSGVTARGSVLKRGPKFTVGEDVLVGALKTPATVVAGPFPMRDRSAPFYVLAYADGDHGTRTENLLVKAQAPLPAHFWFKGRDYDLTATYVDSDGDAWHFNGRTGQGGLPLLDSPDAGAGYRDYSLANVVSSFGPLAKRV